MRNRQRAGRARAGILARKDRGSDLALLQRLSDGTFHSGEAIARHLGISRTAVWKRMAALGKSGVEVYAVKGKGYRLADPVEWLDAGRIRQGLARDVVRRIVGLDVLFRTTSTNDYLLSGHGPHGRVVLSEFQTAGRGRRDSRWISRPGAGICLSLGWSFDPAPASLMLLSLLSGAAVLRALLRCGISAAGLKWPNDVVFGGRKLGGILIESTGQVAGPIETVLGVGINHRLSEEARTAINQPAASLADTGGPLPSRNKLATELINSMVRMLVAVAAGNHAEYLHEWRKHDTGRGKMACLRLPGRELRGRIVDIDSAGMLMMQINGKLQKFSSGELSLRIAS
ncbi:MAG: biotin--[acetyl-CoA-carboxylase] ligase [Gammaproteobacteria bacterium]